VIRIIERGTTQRRAPGTHHFTPHPPDSASTDLFLTNSTCPNLATTSAYGRNASNIHFSLMRGSLREGV